jgi:hypothetical protein
MTSMTEHASCAARLRDGERCRSVAVDGDFCAHHRDLAMDVGEEPVRDGRHVRRRRQDSALARVVDQPEHDDVEDQARDGNDRHDGAMPSDVRPRLAAAAAANLPELERVLLDAATGATRQAWTTITCKHCERQGRYEVVIPDYRVRLDAVEKLLQQGLGRARESQEQPVPQIPESVEAVRAMPWAELEAAFAAQFVGSLAEIQRAGGGEQLLRERLAVLSAGERLLLRTALDAVA